MPACKPGSVEDASVAMVIPLGAQSPTPSSSLPAASLIEVGRLSLPIWPCSRWGLPCHAVTSRAVGSYPTFSPLPVPTTGHRRLFSVALSVATTSSIRPGVTWQRALWSPDFPRPSNIAGRDHPVDTMRNLIKTMQGHTKPLAAPDAGMTAAE